MPLSDTAIRSAKPGPKPAKLSDGGGLYLLVKPNGARLWRFDYRFIGKRKTLAFGAYPSVTLAAARKSREDAKRTLVGGADPAAAKKAKAALVNADTANTFGTVAEEYLKRLEHEDVAPQTLSKNTWLLTDIAKPLADRPIAQIEPSEILDLLQRVEASGRLETARRLRSVISSVFRLGIVTLRAKTDPSAHLVGATKSPKVRNRPAITDPKKLGAMLLAIDGYQGWPPIRAGLLLCALTATRPGEVRAAEWSEIDLDDCRWVIPAERMKMRVAHDVPLSSQAVAVLTAIQRMSGDKKLVFPSIRTKDRPLSNNTFNATLRLLGITHEEHCTHGFRSSFSTIMNDRDEDPEIIELCLAHQDANQVRRTYNRSRRWPDRVAMMERWGNLLDDFRRL